MDVSILPIEEKDFAPIGKMMADYKISTAINRLLWKTWPNEVRQNAQTFDTVQRNFNIDKSQLMKAVDNSSGEVVGFIALNRRTPAPATAQPPSTGATEVPEQFNPDVFNTVIKAIGEIGKETEHLDHVEITAINVRPDCHRKGIGSKLVGVAFDRARAEKIPVVMRSEPASHKFFRKIGFKETKTADLDLAAWAEPLSGYGIFRLVGFVWYP